jgi:IMP dehydrogenase
MATLSEIFDHTRYSYSYDDLIMLPGFIDFPLEKVNLETHLTDKITLKVPILSSPMDTVTEHKLAIQLALQGGLGIIHNNNSIETQVAEVLKVKRYNNGFIDNPVSFSPDTTLEIIIKAQKEYGFNSFPILDQNRRLVGSVSKMEVEFRDLQTKVADVMKSYHVLPKIHTKSREDWSCGECSLSEAQKIIKEKKCSRLFVVDSDRRLISLITRKDILGALKYPLATKCRSTNQLLVGAAVSTHLEDRKRIRALYTAGVDLLVIDSAQGNSSFQIETIEYIKTNCPKADIMAGNVVTRQQGDNLVSAGAQILRVGMGVGSICTTQKVCGVGRGQASAIVDTQKCGVPIIADGGLKNSGDIIKAFALGSAAVMLGSMLAGTDESPSEYLYEEGFRLKKYRGMGSLGALKMRLSKGNRYNENSKNDNIAQGVEGSVVCKGPISVYLPYLVASMKHGFQDLGVKTLDELHEGVQSRKLLFELRSPASSKEGEVHSLFRFTQTSHLI